MKEMQSKTPKTPESIKTYWSLKEYHNAASTDATVATTARYVVIQGNSLVSMRSSTLPVVPCLFGSYIRFFERVANKPGVIVDVVGKEILIDLTADNASITDHEDDTQVIEKLLREYLVFAAANSKPAKVRLPLRQGPVFSWDDEDDEKPTVRCVRPRLL